MKMTDTSIAHCCVVLLAVFRGSGSGDGHSSGDSGGGMALLLQNLNIYLPIFWLLTFECSPLSLWCDGSVSK